MIRSPFIPESEPCGEGYNNTYLEQYMYNEEGFLEVFETFDEAIYNCRLILECFGVTKDGVLGESKTIVSLFICTDPNNEHILDNDDTNGITVDYSRSGILAKVRNPST